MGHPHYNLDADPTKQAHGAPTDWSAPRLSVALLRAKPGQSDVYRTDLETAINRGQRDVVSITALEKNFKTELAALCQHIHQRLEKGLAEAWFSEYGYATPASKLPNGAPSMRDNTEAAYFWDEPEEKWARAFVEMSVYSMYHTPGQVYGTPGNDAPWFDRFPKVHSIAMACQTLSTYCVLSRGFQRDAAWNNGLGCSAGNASLSPFVKPAKPKPMVPKEDTKKKLEEQGAFKPGMSESDKDVLIEQQNIRDQVYTPTFASMSEMVKDGATPGSVAIFNEHGSASNDQNPIVPKLGVIHIASVLRVSGSRLQFIDTGVVTGKGEASLEAGTVDHEFTTGQISEAPSLVAFGPASAVKDETLTKWAEDTASCKPLGLTRLVILTSPGRRVLFVSKLLHMRWPVSKLIWSLRGLPARDLTVAWLVFTPKESTDSTALADALGGTPSAPSSLVKGAIRMSNILVAGLKTSPKDDKDVHLWRSRTFSEWRSENGGKDAPDEVMSWRFGDAAPQPAFKKKPPGDVIPWCQNADNFGKCYVRTLAASDAGSPNHDPIGSTLVDL